MTTKEKFQNYLREKQKLVFRTDELDKAVFENAVERWYYWLNKRGDGELLKKIECVPSIEALKAKELKPPVENGALMSSIRKQTFVAVVASEIAERDEKVCGELLDMQDELMRAHEISRILSDFEASAKTKKIPFLQSQLEVGVAAFCQFCVDTYDPTDESDDLLYSCRYYLDMANNSFAALFGKDTVYYCERPVVMIKDDQDRLHSIEKGKPAVQFKDGTGYYVSRGMVVPTDWVANGVTSEQVTHERNSELRRVAMTLYGEANYLRDMNATLVDEKPHPFGKLWKFEDPQLRTTVAMLEVENPTQDPDGSRRKFFLLVDPQYDNAEDAWYSTYRIKRQSKPPEIMR